jgi:hypothetical protein
MQLLREILGAWGEVWRYPGLVSLLDRGQEAAPKDVELAILDGLAVPRSQREAFAALLRQGEFRAAEKLLECDDFRAAVAERESPEEKLEAARRRAREESHMRMTLLVQRSRRAGRPSDPPAGIDQALRDSRTRANVLLDRWEAAVAGAEVEARQALRARLEAACLPSDAPADASVWRASVERCIDAGEFEVAQFLLDGGPGAPPPEGPLGVPRRAPWPWDEPPAEVLDWFEGKGAVPPDFASRWRHAPDDQGAAALVRALRPFIDEGPTPATAAALAAALETFLGHAGPPERKVVERENGLETRLYGLADARLPFLGITGDAGVRFWLPRRPGAEPQPEEGDEGVVLCFTVGSAPSPRRRAVWLDVRSLFRLLGDRAHRRTNFLREVGGRVDLQDAIPARTDALAIPRGDASALGVYARWLFDLLNVEAGMPVLGDVLVFRAGARPGLLLLLIRALFESASWRRSPVHPDAVSRVWHSAGFREAARAELLAPLTGDPRTQVMLAASLLAGLAPGGIVTNGEVRLAFGDLRDEEIGEQEVQDGLRRLVDAGLLEAVAEGQYRIPPSGVGFLLLDLLDDLKGFAQGARTS